MNEERFFELLSRKLAGEANIQELEELARLLSGHPDLASFYRHMVSEQPADVAGQKEKAQSSFTAHALQMQLTGRFAAQASPLAADPVENTAKDFESAEKPRPSRVRRIAGVAAVAACVGAAFVFGPTFFKTAPVVLPSSPNEVVTRKASKSKLTLSDGTTVWLNADSKLTYQNFSGRKREVTLIGEGFFDVVKDSLRPFLIHAGNVNIKVLGTAFNIKAYPGDGEVETALLRGLIELTTDADPERKILLRPNEKLTVKRPAATPQETTPSVEGAEKESLYSISPLVPDKKDSTLPEVAWMQNRLVFRAEAFEVLSRRMERWYDVKIAFADEAANGLQFTGAFEHESIAQALEYLQFTSNRKFRFTIEKNQITIASN